MTAAAPFAGPFMLRPPRPGDIGWLIARHGELYAGEYGWDERFEGLVAEIAGRYLTRRDPAREAAWIAEDAEGRLGSVMLVQARDEADRPEPGIAQLRLLIVEPRARGRGVGAALVDACTRFAIDAGYRRIRLWTQQNLDAARRLYRRAGYQLLDQAAHHSFGAALVGERWELALPPDGPAYPPAEGLT